ncbi:MAG TPA: undecaprenyl-diphosphate phosphatase [Opitutaceae bacterium]|nr:undecaprenyl-diphosphate phosphatase [Opitutaceae bacterium]
MTLLQVLILAVLQGAAELLPVSSSAHVIVAEKLMHLDPSTPEAMFVLAMLHTGTMFAVLIYFWGAWRRSYFSSAERFWSVAKKVVLATAITGIVGYLGLVHFIEHHWLRRPAGTGVLAGAPAHGDIEELSRNTPLLAGALAAAGVLIIIAGLARKAPAAGEDEAQVGTGAAAWMGLAQAICLPFRGLSRSGTTISTGLLAGSPRRAAEEFSFALVIVLTPFVIGREFLRLKRAYPAAWHSGAFAHLMTPGLIGLILSFLAGLAALRWLSAWLEQGRWHYFGYYCVAFAVFVLAVP